MSPASRGQPTRKKARDFRSSLADVQQRPAHSVRTLSSLHRPDYLDLFEMTGDLVEATPRQWAVIMFEREAGIAGQVIWRLLLGMHLERKGATRHIAGWRVDACGDDWVRLAADGPLMSGNLIVRVQHDRVWLATVVEYNRRLGGWLWRMASIVHRKTAPSLLRDSLTRLKKDQDGRSAGIR